MKLVSKALKGALKYGLTWFVAVYIGLGGYAVCDYKLNHSKKIEGKTKNNLVIEKYNIPLENLVKELTIVGEDHIYNAKETEFAKGFINKFKHVAEESSDNSSDSLVYISAMASLPAFLFYTMGSGRSFYNPTLSSLAKQEGKTVYFLEEGKDEFKKRALLGQRLGQLGYAMLALAAGPVGYFEGKRELDGNIKKNNKVKGYIFNMDERDGIMAENILKILEKDGVDSLLCIIGKAHVPGVVEKLKDKVTIKRIYN